jgi:hypothetical protein
MEQYIYKTLFISGCHLNNVDRCRILSGKEDVVTEEDDYSITIHVDQFTKPSDKLHKQTRDLIRYAKNNNILKIKFDCDGDVVPSLIEFNYD